MRQRFSHIRLWGALAAIAALALFSCVEQNAPTSVSGPTLADNAQDLTATDQEIADLLQPSQHKPSPPPESASKKIVENQSVSVKPVLRPEAHASKPHIFHSYFINEEVRFDNIQMFPGWTDMIVRYYARSRKLDAICGAEPYSACKMKDWAEFLSSLRGAPLAVQMEAVNRFINQYPYMDDVINWGIKNYWETPYEFQRISGNGKDYAAAKFMALRALGVPDDAMRVEIVRDLNLGGIVHAVLVVFNGGKTYMLDNRIKQIIPTDKVYHYAPIYSLNEQHWWQHFMVD